MTGTEITTSPNFLEKLYGVTIWKIYANIRSNFKLYSTQSDLTEVEKYFLYKLAKTKSGVFVEIGSYIGSSALCFCSSFSDPSRSKLYCIDTWNNDAMTEGRRDTYDEFLLNTSPYRKNIIELRGMSHEQTSLVKEKIDLLFIDGDHSYNGVRTDVESWFPKLNEGALVIIHDVGWAEGVKKIIEERVRPIAKIQGQLPNLYWAYL